MIFSGRRVLVAVLLACAAGCRPHGVKPVDLYPEDICSTCRMAVSDERFAAEIIDDNGEVFKFDDVGCMLSFRTAHRECAAAGLFVKDYETRQWIPYERAVVIRAGLRSPMGSGIVAFADSSGARRFTRERSPGGSNGL